MTVERGQIVDYDVPGENSAVVNRTVGAEVTAPLLVVTVSDDGKSYQGFAFLPDGSQHFVTVTEPEQTEAEKERATWAFDPNTGQRIDRSETPPDGSESDPKPFATTQESNQ